MTLTLTFRIKGKFTVKNNDMKKIGARLNTFTQPSSYFRIKLAFVERKCNVSLLVPCPHFFIVSAATGSRIFLRGTVRYKKKPNRT